MQLTVDHYTMTAEEAAASLHAAATFHVSKALAAICSPEFQGLAAADQHAFHSAVQDLLATLGRFCSDADRQRYFKHLFAVAEALNEETRRLGVRRVIQAYAGHRAVLLPDVAVQPLDS